MKIVSKLFGKKKFKIVSSFKERASEVKEKYNHKFQNNSRHDS